MIDLGLSIALFLPLFLVVNVLAAIPGRRDLGAAIRLGVRHAVVGSLVLTAVCVVCYFAFGWLLVNPPLW